MAQKVTINIKKLKPMFTRIITTADRVELVDLIDPETFMITGEPGALKEVQRVVSVGEASRGVKEGDLVYIDYDKYAKIVSREDPITGTRDTIAKRVRELEVPTVVVNNELYLTLDIADVKFVIEEYDKNTIEIPDEELKTNKSFDDLLKETSTSSKPQIYHEGDLSGLVIV